MTPKTDDSRILGGMTEAELERRLISGELNEEILAAFKAHLLVPEGENDIQPMLGTLCDLAIEGFRARSSGGLFDAVQLSEARFYRESKEPIGILARAILRANGEMK